MEIFNEISKRHILKYGVFMEKLEHSELPMAIIPLYWKTLNTLKFSDFGDASESILLRNESLRIICN